MDPRYSLRPRCFPTTAGILFGLGLGGFFDGIVFHQILQWHHMVSGIASPDTVAGLRLNTFWDGMFHLVTYLFVGAGLLLLWRSGHRGTLHWSIRPFIATLLLGWVYSTPSKV